MKLHHHHLTTTIAVLACAVFFVAAQQSLLLAQSGFRSEPINYDTAEAQDPIAQLKRKVDDGSTSLEWDDTHGWLPAILDALDVPRSSQTLPFAKGSLQQRYISPTRPRAIYFSDNVYVGWVQKGEKLEFSAVDPQLGAMFYTLEQKPAERPKIGRNDNLCLICHASPRTKDVPGYFTRSVFPKKSGEPVLSLGSRITDHRTPFAERFGGWFVTGLHGGMRHQGNLIVSSANSPDVDLESGANKATLVGIVRTDRYLEPTSDIVAIMVLEHQTQMHNLTTRASYVARQAIHDESDQANTQRSFQQLSEAAQRRIGDAAEDLLQYLLFSDECELDAPIEGTSTFVSDFVTRGPRDSQGRSLREFDLARRLFRFPCSFLIYADSIVALPQPILEYLDARLVDILTGKDTSGAFEHLSQADRQNIREILAETHPVFGESLAAHGG